MDGAALRHGAAGVFIAAAAPQRGNREIDCEISHRQDRLN